MKRFTEKGIAALKPRAVRYDVREADGFSVRVAPNGRKTFCALYVRDGRKTRVSFGKWPAVSLEEAHKKHRALLTQLDRNEDPAAAARKRRAGLTVEALVEKYLDEHVAGLRVNTRVNLRSVLQRYVVPAWGSWKMGAVTRADAKELLRAVSAQGTPQAANHVHAALSAIWNWALSEELADASPIAGLRRPHPTARRDRVLTDEELRAVWRGLVSLGETGVSRALRLILLTGQRPSECAGMDWSEVAREVSGWWWTVPAARAKGKKAHRVPLTDTALGLLGTVRSAGPVFERPTGGAPITARPMGDTMREHLAAWGILGEAAKPHDCRRSVATGLAKLRVPRETIARVLSHEVPGITSVYDVWHHDGAKREALQLWDEHLARVLADDVAPVVPIRRKAKA